MESFKNDDALYRIIDLEGFLSILYYNKERYVWPFGWEDTFEGCGLRYVTDKNNYRKFIGALFSQYEDDKDSADSVLFNYAKAETISRCFYGQCWSQEADSDALWRIYSYSNKAIQIESNKERIIRNINIKDYSPTIRKVVYDVENKDIDSLFIKYYSRHARFDQQFFHKRTAFSHEKEVRVVISNKKNYSQVTHLRQMQLRNDYRLARIESSKSDYDLVCETIEKSWNNRSVENNIFLDIGNVSDYIKTVRVHPQAKDHFVQLVSEICARNHIRFDGKSELYNKYANPRS